MNEPCLCIQTAMCHGRELRTVYHNKLLRLYLVNARRVRSRGSLVNPICGRELPADCQSTERAVLPALPYD